MYDLGIPTPYEILPAGDRVYLTNITPATVFELTVDAGGPGHCSIQVNRSLDFWREGYIAFRDGAFGMHIDAQRRRLYVLVGFVGGDYELGFVELDLDTFRMLREVRLKASLPVIALEAFNTVLLPSYWESEIYEVSPVTMELLRTIPSDPSVFFIEYDRKRGLLYTLSRVTGFLTAIDYATGSVVRRGFVGAKPEPMWLDPASDCLFLGSSYGIIRVDLDEFLAETPASSLP
jgi:hypothetical protein